MTTPQITIHDATTGETVTRDFNETELAEYEADQAQADKDAKAKAKAEQALADKRQIILDRLGLTADELKALLG
tara:strand:- start:255 stop:476 length:222 start_codon:yes stop_codon:yes gene_type:complete